MIRVLSPLFTSLSHLYFPLNLEGRNLIANIMEHSLYRSKHVGNTILFSSNFKGRRLLISSPYNGQEGAEGDSIVSFLPTSSLSTPQGRVFFISYSFLEKKVLTSLVRGENRVGRQVRIINFEFFSHKNSGQPFSSDTKVCWGSSQYKIHILLHTLSHFLSLVISSYILSKKKISVTFHSHRQLLFFTS